MTSPKRLPEVWTLLILQIVCTGSAIAALPAGLIHPGWIAAFTIPSILFLALGTPVAKRFVPSWARLILAAGFQAAAAWMASIYVGSLDERSSLACSLLPALTYFTLRRTPQDTSLSLFLSFCFLLIGILLNNDVADWTLLVFLVACPWAMQIDASNRSLSKRHASRGKSMRFGARFLRRTQVVAALMMTSLCVYFVCDLIPSPGDQRSSPATRSDASTHANRTVGLNNRFDLTGGKGSPLSITADEVLIARDPFGGRVPDDLYLRMTFFDRPGIEEWTTWPFNSIRRKQNPRVPFWCKEAVKRSRGTRKHLVIRRMTPSPGGELYLPPGTIGIQGVSNVEFNNIVGHYRSVGQVEETYQISYQQTYTFAGQASAQRNTALLNRLDDLPASLRTAEIVSLARKLAGPDSRRLKPMQLAQQISKGLQQRCSYALRDPQGSFADPIHNFLFGSRSGYCMHFATALAIMLRIHDVPCRIGVGFQGGKSNRNNSRSYGSQHAHAWVEIPMVNFDWVVVDPTPSSSRARRGWPDQVADPSPAGAVTNGPTNLEDGDLLSGLGPLLRDPLSILRDPSRHPGSFLFLLAVFALVTMSLIAISRQNSRRRGDGKSQHKPTPDAIQARQLLEKILAALSRGGYPKSHRATLEQFATILESRQVEVDHSAIQMAFASYQQVRFGHKALNEARHDQLMVGLETARGLPN